MLQQHDRHASRCLLWRFWRPYHRSDRHRPNRRRDLLREHGGHGVRTLPNSGAVGPNEVNTSNGSGVASFTPFLSLPQGASVSTSPVADPTGGSTLATFSTIVTQATTAQGNNREFLLQCGLTSTLGSGQSNSNGDKACLFAATQGNSGSGNIWGQVDAAVRGSGSGTSYNVMGLEVDANNFGGSVGGSSASSLPANTSFGMSVTGKSDANNFTNTGAILIQSLGGTCESAALCARHRLWRLLHL